MRTRREPPHPRKIVRQGRHPRLLICRWRPDLAFFGHPPLRAVVSGGLLGHRTSVPTFLFLVPVLDVLDWRPEAVAVHRLEARLDCVLHEAQNGKVFQVGSQWVDHDVADREQPIDRDVCQHDVDERHDEANRESRIGVELHALDKGGATEVDGARQRDHVSVHERQDLKVCSKDGFERVADLEQLLVHHRMDWRRESTHTVLRVDILQRPQL
mmetsp:Transcript_35507/g.60879  ORF Transcript_35507/g.60879 Transcript_35507/m.60879 type:complete len:213 (+) Transcript_35507:326-964(+)